MTRDIFHEAAKLIAHLGWKDTFPALQRTDPAPTHAVPIRAFDPKAGDIITDDNRNSAYIYDTLVITQPYKHELPNQNTHPYEWALKQIATLDPAFSIKLDRSVTVPEIGLYARTLHDLNTQHHDFLAQRNAMLLVVAQCGADPKNIADVLGVTTDQIYRILSATPAQSPAHLGISPATTMGDVVEFIKKRRATMHLRSVAVRALLFHGLTPAVISRLSGMSRAGVINAAKAFPTTNHNDKKRKQHFHV